MFVVLMCVVTRMNVFIRIYERLVICDTQQYIHRKSALATSTLYYTAPEARASIFIKEAHDIVYGGMSTTRIIYTRGVQSF